MYARCTLRYRVGDAPTWYGTGMWLPILVNIPLAVPQVHVPYRYSYYRYGDWAFSGSQKLLMLVFPAPVEFGANIWSPSRYHQYIITRNYERQTFCFVRVRLNFSYRGFGLIRWEKIVTPESSPSLQLQKTTTSPKIIIFLSDRLQMKAMSLYFR